MSVYEAYSWQCVGSLYNGPEQQEQVDQAVDDVSLKKRICVIKKTLFINCICTLLGFPISLLLQYYHIQLTTNIANVFISNLTTYYFIMYIHNPLISCCSGNVLPEGKEWPRECMAICVARG